MGEAHPAHRRAYEAGKAAAATGESRPKNPYTLAAHRRAWARGLSEARETTNG